MAREIKFRAWDKEEKQIHYDVHDVYDGMCSTIKCDSFGDVLCRTIEDEGIENRYEVMQYTGLKDKNGKEIYEGDITELILSNGEIRHFKVSFKKVIRKVLCHPDFDDKVARVELNAVVFEWNGYELFPCIDDNGKSDVSKMEVIGNIYENPELLNPTDSEVRNG